MCGICGVIQIAGTPREVVPSDVLDRMTDVMTHRGPNDRGCYVAPGIAVGVRRLSIVDVEGGHQPISNEDGTVWGAQNGELYNHRAVRVELEARGHRLTTSCDTEIIPHLYEDSGDRFPERLRGMFGLVVWDGRRRRALVARDRLGIKPMYWAQAGDLVIFGSELKSVLASGLVDGELDYDAIDAYLSFGFTPAPRTPLAAVSKLPPGHLLVVGNGTVRAERWWDYPEPNPGDPKLGVEHYASRLTEELDTATRLRLMSDVPLGAMLSGGIDSSMVVATMARHMSEPVKTFSIGFADAPGGNELGDARLVASSFGTDHHELEISFDEPIVSLEDLVWLMDEPVADLSALGFYALSELAARSVTVALSGQGADELLGGYLKHRAAALCDRWDSLPRIARAGAARVAPHARGRFRRAARTLAADSPGARLMAMGSKVDPALRVELFRGPLADPRRDGGAAFAEALLVGVPGSVLGKTLYADAQLALVDDMLHYFDRTSMAHSLEVRVPFLDHHLVEFAATVPDSLKVRGQTTKFLLKHVARSVLPPEILKKPKLGFFRENVSHWFRSHADKSVSDYVLAERPRFGEFLDRGRVEALVRKHLVPGSRTRTEHLLLGILMLEIWLSDFLPRAQALAQPVRQLQVPA
jgi:asparagine synthase (glutamine-hydrolysing)